MGDSVWTVRNVALESRWVEQRGEIVDEKVEKDGSGWAPLTETAGVRERSGGAKGSLEGAANVLVHGVNRSV